jgi:anaerobic magnesium-protoporphyrin IX monomethyl ester cyclase
MKDDEWLDEFAEKFPKEVGLPFHCLMRANLITEPLLLKLKKAGLGSISMSIESGNAHIRDVLLKRNMSEEVMLDAFKLCEKHKIPTFSNTIFAIPGSSIKEDIEGLDLNIKAKVTFGEFPVFFPYPKTELGEYSIEHGYFDGDFDKLHMNYQTDSPLNCFSKKEKLMQVNLSLLATVCLLFPSMRNITVKLLIKLPLTKLYFVMYYFTKAYLIKTKIYPMKFSILDSLRTFYESFVLERFKHHDDTSLLNEGTKDSGNP